MHPLFKPNNIKELPPSLKTCVVKACAPDASSDSVKKVVDYFNHGDSITARFNLLPAIYIILDPRRIPDTANDAPLVGGAPAILERAWTMLSGLGHETNPLLSILPGEIAADELLSRMWPWFELFDRQCSSLSFLPQGSPSAARNRISEVFITIIAALEDRHGAECLERMCLARPGLLRMITQAWPVTHQLQPPNRAAATQQLVLKCVCNLTTTPWCRDEIISGAGGSVDDVARVTMLHLRTTIERLKRDRLGMMPEDFRSGPTDVAPLEFTALMYFLWAFNQHDKGQDDKQVVGEVFVSAANHGFVQVILDGIHAYDHFYYRDSEDVEREMLELVDKAFSVLTRLFYTPGGDRYLVEAIEHHLLPSILRFSCAKTPPGGNSLEVLIQSVLPSYSTRLEVLVAFRDHVFANIDTNGMRQLSASSAFRALPLFKDWTALMKLLQRRMTILYRYNAGKFPSPRMCDSGQCGHVGDESLFMRCSGCRMLYYCSKLCQKKDWTEGGHKQGCSTLHALSEHESKLDLSPENRDFLRVLVDADTAEHEDEIIQKVSNTLIDHPRCSCELVTMYDYSDGHLMITVEPAGTIFPATQLPQVCGGPEAWKETVRRAAVSRGKTTVHVVAFLGGSTAKRFLLLPFRAPFAKVHKLKVYSRLCVSKPREQAMAEMRGFYEALKEDESECVEFH
ncbi:MYND-type domain-containing protein [Mycena indigotica]|uniref:MYND-type domain-containing protein n=1 Tax=Mycena indigotica TaxID=2126181 RepID=A0A8H6SSR9_9AGAR|nr:MYND-type domain-containing protein [Mycena indigotica]KAF7304016.1 MYND-type domain-containing protein [Mycena indigotica]